MNDKIYILILSCVLFISCGNSSLPSKNQQELSEIVNELMGKHIVFPKAMYNDRAIDSLLKMDYKLVVYTDSVGCTECHLSLGEWSVKIREMKVINKNLSFVFIVNNSSELVIRSLLNKNRFDYPVFIDHNNSFYKLNSLKKDHRFQVFLLDRENNILLIGDPIRNDAIWELYKKTLNDEKSVPFKRYSNREIAVSATTINLGEFSSEQSQSCIFTLYNTGENMLVINDVVTSCGCTSVEYSKEPVSPGKSLDIIVTYKADHPEHFNKTITVYCNSSASPLRLKIMGNAK